MNTATPPPTCAGAPCPVSPPTWNGGRVEAHLPDSSFARAHQSQLTGKWPPTLPPFHCRGCLASECDPLPPDAVAALRLEPPQGQAVAESPWPQRRSAFAAL